VLLVLKIVDHDVVVSLTEDKIDCGSITVLDAFSCQIKVERLGPYIWFALPDYSIHLSYRMKDRRTWTCGDLETSIKLIRTFDVSPTDVMAETEVL